MTKTIKMTEGQPVKIKKVTRPIIYTEEFVKEQVEKILTIVLEDKEIVYLGEVFENLPYPRENWSRWANDFKDVEEISHTIKRVDEILENRVNIGGLKGKLNPTMSIFNLKNNYGWKDQKEIDHTSKGESIKGINYIQPPLVSVPASTTIISFPYGNQPSSNNQTAPSVAKAPKQRN